MKWRTERAQNANVWSRLETVWSRLETGLKLVWNHQRTTIAELLTTTTTATATTTTATPTTTTTTTTPTTATTTTPAITTTTPAAAATATATTSTTTTTTTTMDLLFLPCCSIAVSILSHRVYIPTSMDSGNMAFCGLARVQLCNIESAQQKAEGMRKDTWILHFFAIWLA